MISFSKFLNKNNSQDNQTRIEPGLKPKRQALVDDDQDALAENPELQRSRHRLIGAGFLLLVAVIGLPRIFDSAPKKINNDVVLKVVSSVGESTSSVISGQAKNETPPPAMTNERGLPTSKNPPTESKTPDVKASTSLSKDNEEEVIAESKPKINDMASDADKNTAVDKPKGKFYIQIATFSSNERAKKVAAKLKDANVSTYVIQRKKESDDGSLYLLRSGPFSSRKRLKLWRRKFLNLTYPLGF
jgi:DedD protein